MSKASGLPYIGTIHVPGGAVKATTMAKCALCLLLPCFVLSGGAPRGAEAGSPAPDFALFDLDGVEVRLSDQLGKVVLLTFWGSGCKEALAAQFPVLQQQVYDVYDREQVAVFSIHIGIDADVEQIKACREEIGVTFPILLEGLRASMEFGIFATPNAVLVDQDGIIRHKETNKLFDEETRTALEALVAELPAAGE